jgi:GTP-binding protein EngB required for normal cell division
MTQSNDGFKAATIGSKFKSACVKFDNLLAKESTEELTAIRKRLREGLKDYQQQGVLSVAFVGQYSAGKSTIISALTGRRDIRIDADIATDKTSSYSWNGIKVIDTPGLFTERKDHDDITYNAIEKSDLLVFCLTYMLFDSITVENFKKLAFDKGYRWKIMLLVNKMSDEAGTEEQKIASYRKSLADALKPHSLDEFPVCFIDAKDYCDGVDDQEEFLIEISRFGTFIDELNKFVERRASLARLDTPVRIALGCIDEAQVSFTRNSKQDSAFLEVLTRLSRTVRKERDRLRTKVQGITLKMSAAVAQEGFVLAAEVGTQADFSILNQQAEINIRQHYEQAEDALQTVINAAVESIQLEVEKVLQSDLTQAFVARLEADQKISAQNFNSTGSIDLLKGQVGLLEKIGKGAGASLTKAATRGVLSTAKGGFLGSMDVAGSSLHQGVLVVGKFVGFKFKPWQAVGIAKNLGNAAKFLGPAMALVSVGVDAYSIHQERETERKMSEVRSDITSQFQAIAKNLETQIESQLREFETQVYGEIDRKIAEARHTEESAIAGSNEWVKQLIGIRQEFEGIIAEINAAMMPPIN